MKNIDKLFREVFGMDKVDKVRIAKSTTLNINKKDSDVVLAEDGTTNTILGLLAQGDMNCAGRPISDTLFGEEENNEQNTVVLSPNTINNGAASAEQPADIATGGQVNVAGQSATTDAEKKEEEQEKQPERPKDTKISRFFGSLKKFGRSLVEPDVNE